MSTNIVYPMTSEEAIQKYPNFLKDFERKEIKRFPLVYYLGEKSREKLGCAFGTMVGRKVRNAIFEENGDFCLHVHAHIRYRYQILELISNSAFSNVVRAFDHKMKCVVAIKILRNTVSTHTTFKNEIKILDALRRLPECKDKVVKALDRFTFRYAHCLVFEMMACDLHNLLELRPQGLPVGDVCLIIKYLCASLEILHRKSIIHLDVKPENVAFRESGTKLALIDFGISAFRCSRRRFRSKPTPGYQAPETILGGPISGAVDMWALGCVAVELFTGKMLFRQESQGLQFASIVELLGVPPASFLQKCNTTNIANYISSSGHPLYCDPIIVDGKQEYTVKSSEELNFVIGPPKSRKLPCMIPGCGNGLVLDFVNRCLAWDPEERITALEATKLFLMKVSEFPFSRKEIETLHVFLRMRPTSLFKPDYA